MKRVIGLCGNSGSGKSAVAAYLKDRGAVIIDADEISHQICEPGQPGHQAVRERFQPYFFNDDGTLNRRRLGRVVFANRKELRMLEDALHPIIIQKVREAVDSQPDGLVVIDAALLISNGLQYLADEVWLVKSSFDNKVNRICERDGIPFEQAVARLRNQQSDDDMIKDADVILMNDGTEEMLMEQVEDYLNK